MKRTLLFSIATLAVSGLLAAPGFAQNPNTQGAGPGKDDPNHPRVNQVNAREQNQQDRIANGMQSGSLTPGEAQRLENKQQGIVKQEKTDMAADGGHLTKADQAQLNRKENRVSAEIARDKRNANTASYDKADPNHPRVNQVNSREQAQQDRIANGIRSGALTPKEAGKLEGQEKHINNQEKRDMAANNGHLTNGEQAKLNREQNKQSRRIYNKKHNGATR